MFFKKARLLRKFFRLVPLKKKPRKVGLKHEGEHYNLKEIYEELNRQYFEGSLALHITWFGSKRSFAKTRIVFGAYHERLRLIKIHRRLDQKEVPLHFVSFIIYHEMLHHVLPPISCMGKRRRVHHRSFREREKKFSDYAVAKEFREKLRQRFPIFSWRS